MSSPPRPETRPETAAAWLWTGVMGVALIGLAAASLRARGGADPARARPGPPQPEGEGALSLSGSEARSVAAAEVHRGRAARTPAEIPASGWKDIGYRVFVEFNKDRVLSVAGGVTFYTLLSLVPAIAALVSCYGLFADANVINEHVSAMQGVLPSGAVEIVGEQIKRIASKSNESLGLTFFTSLVLSVWSANAAVKAIFDALNIVYEEEEKRSFVMLNLRSLTFTVGALVFVILALTGVVVLPVVLTFVGFGENAWLLAQLRWPAMLVVLLGGLSLLYRYGPSRERARWRWVGTGSVVAGVLWLVASILFSWYVAGFGNYNETYGSLGAVIGFMTWIWISVTIVLLGAEINAEMEHQTARDTTTGPELPMGLRQARMADTLGAAT
ncbi:hypothetical protein ASG40_00270 [Methylobacterium sp. Leaf399]|nr:hypothetical protein ASG40_00270 [Methylobacterium sp. Leaf399]KQT78265.1 hypothetical protein ASG59_09845 [Methylobacterium sp. Leaf466]